MCININYFPMKTMGTYLGRVLVSLLTLSGMVLSPVVVAAESSLPDSGWNFVSTRNCVGTRNGISIATNYSETPVVLKNGQKDIGNGLKEYTYRCVEPFTYIVSWKPVAVNQPQSEQPYVLLFGYSLSENDLLKGVQKQSFRHGLTYGSNLPLHQLPNNVAKIWLNTMSQGTNLTYSYVWESSENPIHSYTESNIASMFAASPEFNTSSESSIIINDFYYGKYVMIMTFVRNNDGISAIPNMPVEVDDMIPLYVYIPSTERPSVPLTPITPAPQVPNNPSAVNPSSCSPESTNDGSVSLCRGKVITHAPTTIRATVKKVNSRYALLRLEHANKKTLVVRTGKVYSLRGDNDRVVRLRYTVEGREFMLTFGDTAPASEKVVTPNTTSTIVHYLVGVNNYPDLQSYNGIQNLSNAYVNMYTMRLDGDHFSVVSFETLSTGADGKGAVFAVNPNQMVLFEGFKTHAKALELGNLKKASPGGDAPPYKNWNSGKQELCQTNWLNIHEKITFSGGYSCSTSMSVPYQN